MIKNIGFIGLGIMGSHMAAHLIKKNKFLHIINRNSKKTKNFINKFHSSKKICIHEKLEDIFKNCSFIISCVGNDRDLKDIYLSKNRLNSKLQNNTLIVDHTTASAELSIKLYNKFKKKNCYFFDAPISGGEIGAKNGNLSIMVGGNKSKYKNLINILDLYSKSLIYMGKSGNGQLTKMVNQICVAAVIQGLAEGLNFAQRKELNLNSLFNAIKNGAAQSWQLENRAITMWNNKFNFGFMNKLMLKDLNLVFEENKDTKIPLPITKIIRNNYKLLVKKGFDKEDTSNLIRLLR